MKKMIALVLLLGVSGTAFTQFLTELSTKVVNTSSTSDIWATWESATTAGKILSAPRKLVRASRYALIEPNKNLSMYHTGDKLVVYAYVCVSGVPMKIKGEHKATLRGYQKVEVFVEKNNQSGEWAIRFQESV